MEKENFDPVVQRKDEQKQQERSMAIESLPPTRIETGVIYSSQCLTVERKVTKKRNGGWNDSITSKKKCYKLPVVIVSGGNL
jgi:hypothetical protein